jgi:SAM-dependent methyltransferase
LDVGSGAGRLLLEMREFGFKNLSGIDPFLEKDIHHNAEVNVYKKSLDDVIEHYDFIMLHHSFEHMSNPQAALKKIKSVLKPNGQVLIRIPLADSYAYEKYGVNWVELDPPRHFFLHTKKSMQLMIEEQGFKLDRILYDSSNFEIIESEKWKRGIPSAKEEAIFSKKEKQEMSELVDELNQKEKGSRACFYLSHG